MKQKEIKSILQRAGDKILKENNALKTFLKDKLTLNDGLICELRPILSSNITQGYRNKCEFTIGKYFLIFFIHTICTIHIILSYKNILNTFR